MKICKQAAIIVVVCLVQLGVGGWLSSCVEGQGAKASQSGHRLSKHYILALTWHPAFCELKSYVPECKLASGKDVSSRQWSLHGLWPQPNGNFYCGHLGQSNRKLDKSRKWLKLPAIDLKSKAKTELQRIMPGVRSGLDRHEWIKHGTCYSASAQMYFSDSIKLLDAINVEPLRKFFTSNIGKSVQAKDIRSLFDRVFGRGSGQRVRVLCKKDGNRTLISELYIHLRSRVERGELEPVDKLLANAKPVKMGCRSGIIDPVGFQ